MLFGFTYTLELLSGYLDLFNHINDDSRFINRVQ